MKKKLTALLMATLMLASFAACNGGNNQESSQGGGNSVSSGAGDSSVSKPEEDDKDYTVVTDPDEHLVSDEKRTHRKTITFGNRIFVENGETEYVIIDGVGNSSSKEAADFLAKQIFFATGATVPVYTDANQDFITDGDTQKNISYTSNAKYIVYSHEAMESKTSITWATDVDLAYSGYMIQSADESVFMKVNSDYGYQAVTLSFCREVLGYEWYSEDTIVYSKDGRILPTMNIVEKPDFDLMWRSGYISTSGKFATGVTRNETFTFINGNFCHNSFDYLPPANYLVSNPLWYATEAAASPNQLCYTAHGDKAQYDLMLQTAFEGVMQTLTDPGQADRAALTFTRQDGEGHCICESCNRIKNEFNGSLAITYMLFVNDLDDLIQAELQRIADETGTKKREVTVLFFAYSSTASAPVFGDDKDSYVVPAMEVEEDENGNKVNIIWEGDDAIALPFNKTYENGLKCNEHVGVFYAPIDACFEESFYHPENEKFKETFEKWGLLSNRLYGWIYDTNFVDYLTPYNSYDAIPETLRFLKDSGCQFIFNQAQGENTVCTGFSMMRNYLSYTLPRDVNQDAGELVDKYFKNYFREAEKPMREYYESLVAYMEQLQIDYPDIFYTQRRTDSDRPEYWDFDTLQNWLDLCSDAKLMILKYKASDPDLYVTLMKHITIEELFPRWMICQYYTGYYSPTVVREMRQAFVNDCKVLDLRYYAENNQHLLAPYFDAWGITADPNYKIGA